MTRRILFVQGGGEGTHDEWDNKLVDSLARSLGPGHDITYPRMPDEADPNYARWKTAIGQEITRLGDGVIVIGHSIGGAFLINALATDPPKHVLNGIFLLAAPFMGAGGWPMEEIASSDERLGARLPQGVPIHLYHGGGDDIVPIAHLDLYVKTMPQAIIHRLDGRDHQLNDDLSEVARAVRSLS